MPGNSTLGDEKRPEAVLDLLPEGWNASERRSLDFDREQETAPAPPLPFPDASFELIWALFAFTGIAEGWAEWLLELNRLLSDEGRLIVALAQPEAFEELTGERWDESRVGMTVLSPLDGAGKAAVFHSEWWLRAHWGRAFEIVGLDRRAGRPRVLLRKKAGRISAEELRRPEPGEERELLTASANAEYLRTQLEGLRGRMQRRHRHELDAQREEFERELMRKSFEAADLEWAWRGPDSPATRVAAEYEATRSWRITKPMRAVGHLLRRIR